MQAITDPQAMLVEDMASMSRDPYKWVLYSFEWGKGELAEFKGPEEWQAEVLKAIRDGLITTQQAIQIAVASGHGIGKMQKYDCIVPTPEGNKRWGDLKVGDLVFGSTGIPTKIKACHHFKNVPMYRVKFDDGSFCDVSSGHLWNVRGRQERRKGVEGWRTLETIELFNLGVVRSNGKASARQWEIPIQGMAQFEEKPVDVDPYFMGLWLGDGSRGSARVTKPYVEIFDKVSSLGYKTSFRQGETISVTGIKERLTHPVFCMASYDRYIPESYKFNSVSNRMKLFQGLMDSDGEVHGSGSIGYSTTSKLLAHDVIWLARSLGCKAKLQSTTKKAWYYSDLKERIYCRDCYRVTINAPFNPFTLEHRKRAYKASEKRYLTRWISSIEPIDNSDGMCITVANEDGLYLANDFIVTHNSALVAWLILWSLSTFEDTKGVVTANTETQLKTKTWAELAKWYRLFIAKNWFEFTATAIYSKDPEHEKTWRFDMVPWSEHKTEAFAGMHNKGKRIVIIFDEASAIPDVIWEVTEGALTDQNTEILWLCFGNPTRNTGRFYQCFNGLRHRWNHRQIDSRSVTITNKEQINKWVADYGDDSDFCRVRVKGQFPRSSDHQFIPADIVDEAMGRFIHPREHNFAAKIIGVDRAWSGDKTRIWLRQGLMAKRLATFVKGEDDVVVAGHLARLEDEVKADAVFIDFGYGTGLFSVGNQLGRKWMLVGFGEKASDPRYLNKRIEMWGNLKAWLVGGGVLPKDQDLRNDLIGPEAYEVTIGPNAGKIKLESKEDMRGRGLPSPDDADALALTFAYPVMNKSQRQFEELIDTHVDNYDPFKLNRGQEKRPQFNPLSPVAEPFDGVKAQSWRGAITK